MSIRPSFVDSRAPDLEWHSTDGSTRVSFPAELAGGIASLVVEAYKSIPRRGAEIGGFLIGSVRLGRVSEILITSFDPIPCEHRFGPSFVLSETDHTQLQAVAARHPADEIVGYYRSHTRKDFGLEPSDREMVERFFPGRSGIVLLIKPSGVATLTAGYYFFQGGRLEQSAAGPEFEFRGTLMGSLPMPAASDFVKPDFKPESRPEIARLEPARQESVKQESVKPESVKPEAVKPEALKLDAERPLEFVTEPPIPAAPVVNAADGAVPAAVLHDPKHRRRRKSLQWEIVAAGLMIAAALALLWWQYRGDSGEADASSAHPAVARVASLGLAVHPGEGGWRISWDPNSPAARESVSGALNVTEDVSHDRIPLTSSQIRNGAVNYRPIGDDITFRLELVGGDNSLASETYRVILKPHETANTHPKTEPTPEPATKTAESPSKTEEGYQAPEVRHQVSPEVPEGIRPRIGKPIPIDVRVHISREGHVTSAIAIQHGDGLVDFLADRAVAAARLWTFTPAKEGGKPVNSTRTIHFVFEQ